MFPSILKLLKNHSISNSNTTSPISNSLAGSDLSNDIVINILLSSIDNSSNSFAKLIAHIINENPYAIFLFIVMFVLIITIILRFVIYIFTTNQKYTKKHIIKRIWKLFISPNFIWTGLILGIILGVDVLQLSPPLKYVIKGTLFSILLWIFYSISQKIFSLYIRAILIHRSQGIRLRFFKNKNILIVFARVIHAILFLTFITILLGLWGVQLGPILAGLGIAGIAVGFALQDTLSHIIGGVSLMLDEAYTEGDYILLDNGHEGIIFQIGYRSTKFRTFDEEIIIIPNGVLSKMIITNLSQPVKRIRVTTFYQTLASDASPEKIKKILLSAPHNVSSILKYPEPYVFFLEPKGNLFHFRLNFYVSSPTSKLSNTDLVQQEVVKLFKQHNIQFAIDESFTHFLASSHSAHIFSNKSD